MRTLKGIFNKISFKAKTQPQTEAPKSRKSPVSEAIRQQPNLEYSVSKTWDNTFSNNYEGQAYDIMLHSSMAKVCGWLSPVSFNMAVFDWLAHLALSPSKQCMLVQQAAENFSQFSLQILAKLTGIRPQEEEESDGTSQEDHRFQNPAWQSFPFNLFSQAFLLQEKWWNEATTNIRGLAKHHENIVNFLGRQVLDMLSPSNFPFTNPEIIAATLQQKGANLIAGFNNFVEDVHRFKCHKPPAGTENYPVGVKVAITPGKVIYQNHLIELIQYKATTETVNAEPILIVPAWIMKYYILDLSPHNSLVKYLVDHGHTVFMISWRNPDSEDRNLGLEDYLNLGIMSALDVISTIIPNQKIHATGYCLGGTLLMIAAALMAGCKDERLKSITLFAAETDFRDPGELSLFIDQSQICYLEDIMWEKGYLDGVQMSSAFSMLRSNDLIWSTMIHDYLLGTRKPISDLMSWDYDTTRLPLRMHSEYLRKLFLNNDLVQGQFKVNNKKAVLMDIKVPIFAVGTVSDHVAPWRSVYKVHLFTNTDVTFVLTSGGHNVGIVSEPGHKGRSYQMDLHQSGDVHLSPTAWLKKAPHYEGSWWPSWEAWLADLSSKKIAPPGLGHPEKNLQPIMDAPGAYVLKK